MKDKKNRPGAGYSLFCLLAAILLVLAIITAGGCATQRADSAGKVNGVYIKRQDFMSSLRGHFTGFMLEKDRAPDEAEKRELTRQTWRDITIHVILKDYFVKYGVTATSKEVLDSLLNNVPASVRKAPVFQTNGVFDRAKYVQVLLDENSTQLDWLKRYYYEYYIPLAKLKPVLRQQSLINKKDLDELHRILNSSSDVKWIVFDPQNTEVKVNQADIDNYYHSNLQKYELMPSASFGWTAVPVRLSPEDVQFAKARIDSIYHELYSGKSYAVMVKRHSQSPTSENEGSLGFLKTDDLPPEINTALKGLNKNDITTPLRIDNSWVIYQLVERTKTMVKLNELVININPGEASIKAANDRAIQFRDLARELGMPLAAQEMNLNYKESGLVDRDSVWIADTEFCLYMMDRAFTQKPGALLEPVYSELLGAWVVAEVLSVQPFNHKPVMDVSDEIAGLVLADKKVSKTLEDAERWATANKPDYLKAAAMGNREVLHTPHLAVGDSLEGLPVKAQLVDVLGDHYRKIPPVPLLIGTRVLLPVIISVTEAKPLIYTEQDIRDYYFDQINPGWFEEWLEDEIRNARVSIWFNYP